MARTQPRSALRAGLRAVWTSDVMLRLGCIPWDVSAYALLRLGDLARWIERQRVSLDG